MEPEISTYVLIDYSGSTGGHSGYWNYISNIIKQNPTAIYILWDTAAKEVSREEAERTATKREGNGGTQPQCFVNLIPAKSNIILITDGQIGISDVNCCEKILNGREFNKVDVHFYKTGSEVNLSVSTALTRKTQYRIYLDGKLLAEGSSAIEVDLQPYFNYPRKFIDEAENLLNQIIMQNLGKTNMPLRNKLLDLQENLLRSVSISNSSSLEFNGLRELLSDGQYEKSLDFMKKLVFSGDVSMGKTIEKIIQQMLHQCSGSTCFSLNILEPGRLTRASEVDEVAIEELPPVEHSFTFECPIFYEHNIPICLIKEGRPIFSDLDKGYLNNILTNPFLVLNDKSLVDKVKNRIDHLVGLDFGRTLFLQGNVKSPITRDLISSALVLSEHETHSAATNAAMADIFFGKKLVGEPEIWLAVLYFIIKRVPYLSEDPDFMKILETNLIHRMKLCPTNITLSGLPIEPMLKCPMDLAVWYCVVSPLIIENKTSKDDARNRLRSFGGPAKYLVKLVELFGYPYDESWTKHQIDLYSAFTWMMIEEKNHSQWRKLIRAQYQNSMIIENKIILLDGPALNKPPLPLNCKGLSIIELKGLMELVDHNKSVNAIMIPDFNTNREITYEVNYGYPEIVPTVFVKISPKTMRPYVIDRKLRKHWSICSEQIYGPLDKQISIYNYFIIYVHDKGHFPSKNEFFFYIESRQANRLFGVSTLPKLIVQFVDELFQDYQEVLGANFDKITVAEFRRLTEDSRKRENRSWLDGSNRL